MRRFGLHGTDLFNARPFGRALLAALAVAVTALATVPVPAGARDAGGEAGATSEGGQRPGAATSSEAQPPEDGAGGAAAQEGSITIASNRSRVPVGERVTFTGRRDPAARGDRVVLKHRPAGGNLKVVGETTTDSQGRYAVSVKPRRSGRFLVTSPRRSGTALRSGRVEVGVRVAIDVEARRHQVASRGVKVRGAVRPSGARRVTLERQAGKGWQRIEATRTRADGSYRFRWNAATLGSHDLRTRFRGDVLNLGAAEALPHAVHVYRKDHASYYGPGFYGNTTACGQTLRPGTVGVAHKRIRCGARVRFHYRGTTRRIRVIDRGPYIAGRRWDLTDAARRKLGFPAGVDDIWADR